ncbi:MAG: CmcI family methyltransferase [Candidatus Peregrinibacteria bacterium]|nr:CmcI family methyltransferase [Candidatus Peregrinibacteria bacterium]
MIPSPPPLAAESLSSITAAFHCAYYERAKNTWQNTFWLGVRTFKCPLDLWVYQEILTEKRPDIIIETGTAAGGSALFLASTCDALGSGRVITIDIERGEFPKHPRITYLTGSSTDRSTPDQLLPLIEGKTVMVILDSDHRAPHVLEELHLYSPLVTAGQYLIVEDTNVNGNPVLEHFGPGPQEALEEFLVGNENFTVDRNREKFLMTFNPGGYILRMR